jgi:tetratricopeptide (TPR) repeat protein
LKKIDDFYKATKNKSTVSSVFLLTYIYSKMGMFQHAEDILLTLLKNIPNNNPLKREINFIRALLKFEQGKPDEAIYILREIVEKYNFDYYFYDYKLLFAIYLHLKKYQQAQRLLYEVKKKFGNKEGYKQVLSVWEKTIKYKLAKNPQEKVRILRQLGKFVKVSDVLLLVYLENRMWEEAEKLLKLDRDFDIEKWINTYPFLVFFGPPQTRMEAARILAANGVIAYHKGNKKKAREFFQRAIRYAEEPLALFTPLNAEAVLTPRAYLGIIFYEEGKNELARKYLKEAFSKNVPFLGDDEAKAVAQKLGISVR